jgi:hypothetical protein
VATFLLATAGTASLVFISERFNDQLLTDADVAESVGIDVLGSIPDGRRFRRIYRAAAVGNGRSQAAPPGAASYDDDRAEEASPRVVPK